MPTIRKVLLENLRTSYTDVDTYIRYKVGSAACVRSIFLK